MFRILSCAFGCVALGFAASAVADEMPPAPAAGLPAHLQLLTDEALAGQRGGFLGGLLSGLAAVTGNLPPNNTVSVQIGTNPPQTASGNDPQSINLGDFGASAGSGPASPVPLSFSSTTNTTTTRTITRSFSFP